MQLSGTDAGAIYDYDDAMGEFHLRSTYGMDDALIAGIKELQDKLAAIAKLVDMKPTQ